ncbi:MAG: MgtC/SapB family protein [Chitinophagales bacterium]
MDYEIVVRFLLAALWGGIVGAEREYRSKSAGFRTMIMISMGSCLFTILSESIGAHGNPDRIASNIVTGIGFLGAGVIFRGENRVNGITTAATIWAVAAVGMGIGSGLYFGSACASVLILIVLSVLPFLENLIDQFNQSKEYTIECDFSGEKKNHYEKLLRQFNLRFKLVNQSKVGNDLSFTWQTQGHAKNHEQFITVMMEEASVKRFEY